MNYHFTVQVPFEPIVHESLESTASTSLPDEAILPAGLHIKADDELYRATLDVIASRPSDAKIVAIRRVEELLKLFAAWNDAFRVIVSGVRAQVGDPLVEPTATVVETDEGIIVKPPPATVFVSGHLTAVKRKANLDYEASALAARDLWPEPVTRALDLNYLAVFAEKPATKFLLLATALQVLAYGCLGEPTRLLSNKLDSGQYRKLKDALDKLLRQWNLTEDERGRIKSKVFETHKEPVAQHLLSYLEKTGITDYDLQEVESWWRRRGEIAHAISPIENSSLRQPLDRLLAATQQAIRKELESLT